MALLFMDGFNHYINATDKWDVKFDGAGISRTVGGRYSVGTLLVGGNFGSYLGKNITAADSTIVFGGALLYAADSESFITLLQGSQELFSLQTFGGTGVIRVKRGAYNIGTTLGDSVSDVITEGQWQYIECKVFLDNTNGTVEVRVNGNTVINLSGIDTTAGATIPDNIRIGASNGQVAGRRGDWDDLYVLDGVTVAGANPNDDFLGDVKVVTCRPDAAGLNTEYEVVGAPTNFQACNDDIIDDDTTYVRNGTLGARDSYSTQDPATVTGTVGTIFGVQTTVGARKTDAGALNYRNTLVSGGNIYDSDEFQALDNYRFTMDMFNLNPNGDISWTESAVNACEVGFKLESKDI